MCFLLIHIFDVVTMETVVYDLHHFHTQHVVLWGLIEVILSFSPTL